MKKVVEAELYRHPRGCGMPLQEKQVVLDGPIVQTRLSILLIDTSR